MKGQKFFEAISRRLVDGIALRDAPEFDDGMGHYDESTEGVATVSNRARIDKGNLRGIRWKVSTKKKRARYAFATGPHVHPMSNSYQANDPNDFITFYYQICTFPNPRNKKFHKP